RRRLRERARAALQPDLERPGLPDLPEDAEGAAALPEVYEVLRAEQPVLALPPDALTRPPRTTPIRLQTMSDPIRPGLRGCGRIAAVHLRRLSALDGAVRVAAVCDVALTRARAVAAELGIDRAFADPLELLREPLDAVHVLTPPTSHADTAV